jgi:xanthine dehydrogenase small subunit
MRHHIQLFINGQLHRITGRTAFMTLSNYLRYELGKTGTKIVCEEGDCGACTVMIGRPSGSEIAYKPVNSCIQALYQLDSTSIVTVEGLRVGGELNAVQEAMVTCHGAQCGYCTPGFIVAMSALFETNDRVDEQQVRDGLTGNLCRCTGYEPILKAALEVDGSTMPKLRELYSSAPMLTAFAEVASEPLLIEADGRRFFAPVSVDQAVAFRREQAPVTIVQGGTDIGVQANKRNFAPASVMTLSNIPGLDELTMENGEIVVGGKVTLSALESFVRERVPQFFDILHIFGSPQIKYAGTLAGNIANGSPIADTLPFLYVSDARIELTGSGGTREVPIAQFYRGYKTFDLQPDELITRIRIPFPGDDLLRLYKVSRRKDLDISAFTAAIRLTMDGDTVAAARIAYGGVGPVIVRLPKTEAFLAEKEATLATFEGAGRIAITEITPITDVRGSKDYRLQLAENILSKFWHEAFGGDENPLPRIERRGETRPFA